MDQHGKSPTKNKRRNRKNRKKDQEVNEPGRNEHHARPQVQGRRQGVKPQENYAAKKNTKQVQVQQHINLGQPNKLDNDKAKKQQDDIESLKQVNLNLQRENLQSQEIQEVKKSVSDEMDKVAKLLVEQMREINKTQPTFDLRVFGSSKMSSEERARETEKTIKYLAEKMRWSGKCAPQTLLSKQEKKLQEICFRYDELSKLLQRLESLEDKGQKNVQTAAAIKDALAKTSAAKDETKQGYRLNDKDESKQGNKRIEQPSHPILKQSEEQEATPKNTTLNFTGEINDSPDKVLGGSHHGVLSFGRETGNDNLVGDALLRSSPIEEDQKSNSSHHQLSSDDSNEFLAFQAFAAPMKFFRRVKKKFGNLLFPPKKEKAKNTDYDGNACCDNIDAEGGVPGPVLSQPVQRAFLEFQNEGAHGKASNRKGLEQILVTPEKREGLSTKTIERGHPGGLVTQGKGTEEVKNEITEKNVANKRLPTRETSPSLETSQHNRTKDVTGKITAELNEEAKAKRNVTIQSVAANEKVVPAVSPNGVPVDKQKNDLKKKVAPPKGASPLPTISEHKMKQTPNVKVPGNVNLPAANSGSNTTPKVPPRSDAVARKNVQVQHQNTTNASSASPKNVPGKASIPTKTVGASIPKAASPVASGARAPSKDQASPQPQPVPQKEQRKDYAISKTPIRGVVTKGTVSEEKNISSPGKLQEHKDPVQQVVVTTETSSPGPNPHQQGTAKTDNDIGSATHRQENHARGCKSPTGIEGKEKPSPSKVPQIAASLSPSAKANPMPNHTKVPVQEAKCPNSEGELKQDSTQASSPYERHILKARRRIVFEENKKPEATVSAELADTGEVDYETVMPEDFEQAVAEAMDDESFSEQASPKEKATNRRPNYTGNYSPLQDIPESSALEINADAAVQETSPPTPAGRKKKNRGKYATGFANPRKSINCCCEYVCDYCVPSWEWDKVVANQRRKR